MTDQSQQPTQGADAPTTPTGTSPQTEAPPQHEMPLQDGAPPAGGGGGENPEKDVEDWVTGDEPMTGPQHSYLQTLAQEAGEDVPDGLTKAQASQLIDRLQAQTGRGE